MCITALVNAHAQNSSSHRPRLIEMSINHTLRISTHVALNYELSKVTKSYTLDSIFQRDFCFFHRPEIQKYVLAKFLDERNKLIDATHRLTSKFLGQNSYF